MDTVAGFCFVLFSINYLFKRFVVDESRVDGGAESRGWGVCRWGRKTSVEWQIKDGKTENGLGNRKSCEEGWWKKQKQEDTLYEMVQRRSSVESKIGQVEIMSVDGGACKIIG